MEQMVVDFPGGQRVDAHFGPFTVCTDQPSPASPGSAPTPFNLFLASLATCAGIYVLGFCQQRGLDTTGMRLTQKVERDPATRMVSDVSIEIQLPAGFPEKYRGAVARAAEQCAVKRAMENPPRIQVTTTEPPR